MGGTHKTPFLEIHPFTGGGGGGATYPSWFTLPPTQDFGAATVTDNIMTFKYYITYSGENFL